MPNIASLLEKQAADSELHIHTLNSKEMVVKISLDVLGNELHNVIIPYPDHIDMPPVVHLGSVHFGDVSLLPANYLSTRRKGYEGDEEKLRVMKIKDDEGNTFFIIFCGQEVLE